VPAHRFFAVRLLPFLRRAVSQTALERTVDTLRETGVIAADCKITAKQLVRVLRRVRLPL
jgi:hypothetical protein